MKRIGVLGVGAMGRGVVKNLVSEGYEVYIYDTSAHCCSQADDLGATVEESPADVGKNVEMLLASLPTSEASLEAIGNPDSGALAAMEPGNVIVDLSTTSVSVARELYSRAKDKGISFLDGPVSGGPMGAESATMTIMIGGEPEALEKVHPVLEVISGNIFHLGECGAGQTVKICHNMVLASTVVALAESFIVGKQAGVSAETLSEVFGVSVANSRALELFGPNLVEGTYENTIFALSHMHKDATLFMDLANESKLPVVASSAVYQLYNAAMNKGLGDNDMTAVASAAEELANTIISDKSQS